MSVPAPLSQGDLPYISARALFLSAGFEAGCGHPLPDGSLPVGGKGLGGVMHLILPSEWQNYRSLCAAERAAVPEFAAAA
ncbi:MAG: hypothetical protein ABL974_15080 [Prosthecobacter sp.]